MSNRPFRFVHAADLHLEQVPHGMAEVPEHLADLLIDSAYRAAERIFDTACSEHADFVVLSGDVLDPSRTGPRGPLFLVEQFQKLASRGMPVYWAGGTVDGPDSWPSTVRLPENVVFFPKGRPEEVTFERDSQPVVRLLGSSRDPGRRLRPNEYSAEPGGLFTVAAAHGAADPASLKRREIEYWALGGRHHRQTLFHGPHVAHYPGTPQGRSPKDTGRFGCTLVEVDPRNTIRLSFPTMNRFRWHEERVVVAEGQRREDLETALRERAQRLARAGSGTDVLVAWTVAGSGALLAEIRRGGLAGEMLQMLRREFGFASPAVWSLTLAPEIAIDVPPSWWEQNSIRGDFLRAIRDWQADPQGAIDLSEYLPERYLAGSLSSAGLVSETPEVERILAEAAMLGVDLLTAEGSET